MTKQEAKDYIRWYKDKDSEYHYKASFKSTRPFCIDYPNANEKLVEARIVLGIFQWQRTYEQLVIQYPKLTLEQYNSYRKKYNLK